MSNYVMSVRQWALLVLLSVIWGANFFFIEIGLQELGPLTIVFLRIALAALILLSYLYYKGHRLPRQLSLWWRVMFLALLNSLIPFFLITWGQVHIASGLAAILSSTTPVFSVIMTHFLTHDERLTGNKIMAVCLGIVGVCLLVGPEALGGFSFQALGQFAVLGASICYAYGAIRTRQLKEMPVIIVITCTLLAASVLLLPLVFILEPPVHSSYQTSTIAAILYLSVIGTAAGHFIFYYIVAKAGANNTSLVAFMVPITALLLGIFVLEERLGSHALWGMLIIFFSLGLIDGRLLRRVLH